MAKELGKECVRLGCIALAKPGSWYCAVHAWFAGVDRTLGLVAPAGPVMTRIERDAEGLPIRFYPPQKVRGEAT
jgi:hypothetical protein